MAVSKMAVREEGSRIRRTKKGMMRIGTRSRMRNIIKIVGMVSPSRRMRQPISRPEE
jgi:hypothetical protein